MWESWVRARIIVGDRGNMSIIVELIVLSICRMCVWISGGNILIILLLSHSIIHVYEILYNIKPSSK